MTAVPAPRSDGADHLVALGDDLAGCGIALRHQGAEDGTFLRRLFAASRDEQVLAAFPAAMRDSFLDMQFKARQGHYHTHYADALFAILEVEGDAVGRICLRRGPEAHHVVDLDFLPAWRGRGLGGGVLRAVQREAAEAGRAVTLRVDAMNLGAQRLYRRLGFALVAEEPPDLLLRWMS